jgi:hypothetical protein
VQKRTLKAPSVDQHVADAEAMKILERSDMRGCNFLFFSFLFRYGIFAVAGARRLTAPGTALAPHSGVEGNTRAD